jgi:hypothetical protein
MIANHIVLKGFVRAAGAVAGPATAGDRWRRYQLEEIAT